MEVILYNMAKVEEEKAPLLVLMVHQSKADNMITEKYHEAQIRHKMKFSMATLITTKG